MPPRLKATAATAALLALGGWLLAVAPGALAQTRVAFQIATGASSGVYFPVGEAIAGLISHPPGVDRCDAADVCGPTGLVISARTSDGGVDNLRQVNSGAVDSGLAQADTIFAAASGADAFARDGKLTHVRAIGALFTEDVFLVAAAKSRISKVADLRNKRVSLGADDSDTGVTARAILRAWRLPDWRLQPSHESADDEIDLMNQGKLDAFFAVGDASNPAVADLVSSGKARLVPIDGEERDRLVRDSPGLAPVSIPAGAYANKTELQTVSTRAVWVVRDSAPAALVYGITRALFSSANRASLAASYPTVRSQIGLALAADNLPVPLHPGAERYYREMGKKTN